MWIENIVRFELNEEKNIFLMNWQYIFEGDSAVTLGPQSEWHSSL